MTKLDINLVPILIDKKPVLANLLELYAYELTEYGNFDLRDDGFYGYKYLPLYWTDPHRFPYFIMVNGKIAGFVLIIKGSSVSNDSEIWDVSEFFVMKKYKKKSIGSIVAHQLWHQFKGRWQVRVATSNAPACSFWHKIINTFTLSIFEKRKIIIDESNWNIYTFESN